MDESVVMQGIIERAQSLNQTVALPEAADARTIHAARLAQDANIADVILVGDPDQITSVAKGEGVDLAGIEIVDPGGAEHHATNAALYYELRKHKGVSEADAASVACDPLYAATLLLKRDIVDCTVQGAVHSTPDVLRALFQIIGAAQGISLASSCFVMTTPLEDMGVNGAFIYADAGVNPDPTAEQLADIAICSAESTRVYLEAEPKVAMLSFSTMGSASHPDVDKVIEATRIANEKRPDLLIEGEMQVDSAIVPEVAASKCPNSKIAGRANTLIFPDLGAGNIAYKLTQRLARAGAYGPLLQGLAKVGMDLSRGATALDICNVCAIAAVRATAP